MVFIGNVDFFKVGTVIGNASVTATRKAKYIVWAAFFADHFYALVKPRLVITIDHEQNRLSVNMHF